MGLLFVRLLFASLCSLRVRISHFMLALLMFLEVVTVNNTIKNKPAVTPTTFYSQRERLECGGVRDFVLTNTDDQLMAADVKNKHPFPVF